MVRYFYIKKRKIMKKLLFTLSILSVALFSSCEGDPGPAGPPGTNIESEVFEVNGTFTPANQYQVFYDLNPAIFASDNVLVYELSGVDNGLAIWKLLPQVYFPFGDDRIMQFNYDFTREDFSIFVDGNFDLTTTPDANTFFNNRVFRIVIIPGFFSRGVARPDHNNYYETIAGYGINDQNVTILPQKQR